MPRKSWKFNFHLRSRAAGTALVFVFGLITASTQVLPAQTFSVIAGFGGSGGGFPGSLIMDRAGNLYGAGAGAGNYNNCSDGCGTVFKLTHTGSAWILTPLYIFNGCSDGAVPLGAVVSGPDGSLYGTTYVGGAGCAYSGFGAVFKLTPPLTACKSALCPWKETVLYRFSGGSDGGHPSGVLSFDKAGNLYGTTEVGGAYKGGTVYELTPSSGSWTEQVLYAFTGGADGYEPSSGVIFDQAGNLYGTTQNGGSGHYPGGTVFALTPSDSGWTETVIHSFNFGYGGEERPICCLMLDPSGNLYGTTLDGGPSGGGTVFMMTQAQGSWTETTLYGFVGVSGTGPRAGVAMDKAGNLYGTTYNDYGAGSVFKLSPGSPGWTYTSLHDFTDGFDGGHPLGNLVFDANGTLYGTASEGGHGCDPFGCGVAWKITP